jgi:CDP-diacylglycerol--glycerol-3-phosphate 3-phosphatidyltransferase
MSQLVGDVIRKIARHPGRLLAWTGVSPNTVTLTGGVLSVGCAAALAWIDMPKLWAAFLVLACGFIDALDGAVAKSSGRVTRFGGFLDSVVDRVADSSVLGGLLIASLRAGRPLAVQLLTLALISFPLVSYTRAQAEKLGIECKGGLMTRPLRILCLGIGIAVGQLVPVVGVLGVWSLGTAGYRVLHVRRELRRLDSAAPQSKSTP